MQKSLNRSQSVSAGASWPPERCPGVANCEGVIPLKPAVLRRTSPRPPPTPRRIAPPCACPPQPPAPPPPPQSPRRPPSPPSSPPSAPLPRVGTWRRGWRAERRAIREVSAEDAAEARARRRARAAAAAAEGIGDTPGDIPGTCAAASNAPRVSTYGGITFKNSEGVRCIFSPPSRPRLLRDCRRRPPPPVAAPGTSTP